MSSGTGTSGTAGAAPRILIIGANGQLGTELAAALAERYGN
ncbi:MAG: NAD-dependent epimerase, partial [Ralstonia mannitolilytica]